MELECPSAANNTVVITGRPLNKDSFKSRKDEENEDYDEEDEDKKKIKKKRYNNVDHYEDSEDNEENENSHYSEDDEENENSQYSEDDEESNEDNEECSEEVSPSLENENENNQTSFLPFSDVNKESKENKENKKNDIIEIVDQYCEDNQKRIAKCNLIDFDFNFGKDELIILVPDIKKMIFDLKKKSTNCYSYKFNSEFEIPNIFSFSKNFILKNISITKPHNYENLKNKKYSFKLYELDIDKNTNLQVIAKNKSWITHKIIYEKIILNDELNSFEDNKLYSIKKKEESIIINMKNIKISSNKIYCFLFKSKDHNLTIPYYKSKIESENDDNLTIKKHALAENYFINGFEYKF